MAIPLINPYGWSAPVSIRDEDLGDSNVGSIETRTQTIQREAFNLPQQSALVNLGLGQPDMPNSAVRRQRRISLSQTSNRRLPLSQTRSLYPPQISLLPLLISNSTSMLDNELNPLNHLFLNSNGTFYGPFYKLADDRCHETPVISTQEFVQGFLRETAKENRTNRALFWNITLQVCKQIALNNEQSNEDYNRFVTEANKIAGEEGIIASSLESEETGGIEIEKKMTPSDPTAEEMKDLNDVLALPDLPWREISLIPTIAIVFYYLSTLLSPLHDPTY